MNNRHTARLTLAFVLVCLVAALAAGTSASRRVPAGPSAPAAAAAPQPAAAPQSGAQTFNLTDFGATPGDQTDDAPALQAALNAVVAAGGGTLHVPAGRFVLMTPVSVIVPAGSPTPSVEIRGVGPGRPIAHPHAGGYDLTKGLGLVSEFAPSLGGNHVAILLWNFRSLLVKDLVFIGTAGNDNDAKVTIAVGDIDEAVIQHCEFYGLISQVSGGSIIQAMRTHLTIRETAFLGSTTNSGLYTPIVQNWEWKGITVEDTVFADYGQRAELYGKMGYGAAFCWVNVGDPLPPTPDSPRREFVMRRVFMDEGGWQGVNVQPARYMTNPATIDLFYVTGLYVNVSNFWQTAHYITGVREVLAEDSLYTWATRADSAIYVYDAKDVIIDRVKTEKAATRLRIDYLTKRVTVIDSIYEDLASSAAETIVLDPATPDDDPVLYVRTQFGSALGREPDAAAHYYWSRKLLDCGADASCLASQRAVLAAYLATTPAPTFVLTGRALDENGQPLSGVPVTLSGSQSVATATGADGSYRFARLPTSGVYTVTAGAKRHYTFQTPAQTVVTPAGAQTVDFNATLNRHAIAGRLLDEQGRAIQGATLTLSGAQAATATSDANGNYSFASLPAGRNYTVTASSTRHTFAAPAQSFTDLDANKTANFSGTALFYTITGQAVDPTNKPLTGLSIALSGGKTAAATTGPQGNYSFADVPRGGSYTVTPGKLVGYTFVPASKTFNNLTADQTAVFSAVTTNYNIAGRVTSGGTGLAGVTVTLAGSKSGTATTDSAGAYTFSVPAHGDFTVTPSKTHYTFDRASAAFNGVAADRTADFVATLKQHRISGTIRRTTGAAMGGVTVTLSGGRAAATSTDSQGLYTFVNLPAGAAYTVTPSKLGYELSPAPRTFNDLGANQTADFTITPSNYALSGRVTDTTGGGALAGVTVTLSGAKTGAATTDAQGNYAFTVTSEGRYTVTATKTHYTFSPPALTVVDPTSAQTVNFDATLNRHKINGRVVDKNNAGIAGVDVALTGSLAVATTTDAQGNYSLTNLLAGGNYTLTASKAHHSFSPAGVPVNNLGSDQTLNFSGGINDYTVAGRVTSGGNGLAGVTVTLSGSKSGTAVTGAAGAYSFSVPAGGNYTVTPALRHYTFAPAPATFTNLGGNQTADFGATLNRHAVSGRVAYANDAGVPGVAVALAGSQTGAATTDAQGNFSFTNVPAGGNYTVTPALAHHTFAPPSRSFNDLSANASAAFTAAIVSYRVAGRVTEKGAPLAGVTVDLAGTHALLGAQTGKATTGDDGAYSFTVPALGNYTVTPSKKNYAFDPASATLNALASDGAANFAATLRSVVGFAATSYAVAEGGGSVTVTVAREGDTSTEASVVYEGHGGTAKLGSDFVAAIGLVTFAPGETSKTFTVFITDDGFAEGSELFTLTLTPADGAVVGDAAVASVTINDNDATTSPSNPLDDDEFFVRQHYRDFFSREPDAPGLKFWTDEIKRCGTDARCREARRVSVSAAFFLSIEFKETGFFVYRLYRASFGRAPARVVEFMLDSRVVGDGVAVGGEGWAERLAANKRAFLEEWTHRPEFEQRFGGLADREFVNALFQNMGVTLTDARRDALLAKLTAGATRAQVLAEVIDEEQFNKQEFNRAFVLMQYFGYLRRSPNAPPDSDLTGYNHWLGKLNEFNGDYEKAEMVKAFLSSAEYRGRFGN